MLIGLTLIASVCLVNAEEMQLSIQKTSSPPNIDGNSEDTCWIKNLGTNVPMEGLGDLRDESISSHLKMVHDGKYIYLLVTWNDSTNDSTHRDFEWKPEKKMYLESSKIEDMFSVSFNMKGKFTGNMLSPVEASWDVWQWGAARTNPIGYARDLKHLYTFRTLSKRIKPVSSIRTRDGRMLYIARPEDIGVPVYKKVRFDSRKRRKKTTDIVKQFTLLKPTGSAAHVRAKGSWSNGKWTLEFKRKLNTLAKDDVAFSIGKGFQMALAAFDCTEKGTHYASEIIDVKLLP